MKKTSLTLLAAITTVAPATIIISCNKKNGNSPKVIIKTPSQKADVLNRKMVNKLVKLTETINLDLGVETNQTKILNAIKGLNNLTNDEKNAIELVTKIGLITKDGLPVKVKLHNLTSKIVTFIVKRELTSVEKDDVDISLIKQELDKVSGNDLTIVLPSSSKDKEIADNKDSIEKELRKMITGDDTGAANHNSMKGVIISVSMDPDSSITTKAQKIIVTLKKGTTEAKTNAKFQVKRELTTTEVNNADITSVKQELDKVSGNDLTIVLPSSSKDKEIADNKDSIEKELRKMITGDDTGAANHNSMKGVTISVSMDPDSSIITTAKAIIVTLSKGDGTSIEIKNFKVKRELTTTEVNNVNNANIQSIKTILDAKTGDDSIIVLSGSTRGYIIADNKDSIEKELRKMITKDDTGAANHNSMKGVTISVSMRPNDLIITTKAQKIIVTLKKGTTEAKTNAKFQVKRELTTTEVNNADITSIKQELDKVSVDDLTIMLPSSSKNKEIADNKDSIEKELRKMITGDDTGAANHNSMKGVTISVSMVTDSPITITAKEIIITLSKGDGTPITINNFKVKRELTTTEVNNVNNANIQSIKTILDAKTGDDLTIVLPSSSKDKEIADNKDSIEKELRKMITKDDTGAANHNSMKGVIISVSMDPDSSITTKAQKIIVTLKKGTTEAKTNAKFQVKRELTTTEVNNADITSIKQELDKVSVDDLTIMLPAGTWGRIIYNNEQKILKKLRKMITKDDTGAANHNSMKGVTISVSMVTDSPITTKAKKIIVTLSKGDGTSIKIKNFKVRKFTIAEEYDVAISLVQKELDKLTGDDLIITLSSSTKGEKIMIYRYSIQRKLRKKVTKDKLGDANNPLMKGVTISVSMATDSLITTTAQDITVTLKKGNRKSVTTKKFKVKRESKNSEKPSS